MNFQELIDSIDAYIKTNGVRGITGEGLNAILKNIANVCMTGHPVFYAAAMDLTFLPSFPAYLQRIIVSNNQLSVLPPVSGIPALAILYCDTNQLTVFPSVTGLTSLKEITVSANQLTSFPSLAGLNSLVKLELQNNLFNQAGIDNILVDVDNLVSGGGATGGVLKLDGNTAPSSTGIAAKNDLVSNYGWTVITD